MGDKVGPFPANPAVAARDTEDLVAQLEAEAAQELPFSADIVFEVARRALEHDPSRRLGDPWS